MWECCGRREEANGPAVLRSASNRGFTLTEGLWHCCQGWGQGGNSHTCCTQARQKSTRIRPRKKGIPAASDQSPLSPGGDRGDREQTADRHHSPVWWFAASYALSTRHRPGTCLLAACRPVVKLKGWVFRAQLPLPAGGNSMPEATMRPVASRPKHSQLPPRNCS